MDPLEQELKQALARMEAPAGFAGRVIAKTRPRTMPRWAAAAAVVVMAGGGGTALRYRQGVQAKEQVMLAMRVTAQQLTQIQVRVKEVRR